MNKTELILTVAEETGFSRKNVELALNAALSTITRTLTEGEKVQLVGFGAFETKHRAERIGRNPQKPEEEVVIAPTTVPVFKAGKALKEAVNQ